MLSQEIDHMKALLEEMWHEHRAHVKALLIGLTRDLNLADDLLQETYLNARAGMAGYTGGNSRAWLSQIARRVFFTHRRRRYIRMEEPYDLVAEEAADDEVGSLEHLTLIEIHRAVAELDPLVKAALIMKHYGGLTYKEIAERQGCPVGTAKWRINSALDRLRKVLVALEEDRVGMECKDLSGTVLMDYVCKILPVEQADEVGLHLANCIACRKEADSLRKVATALDAIEQENKTQVFYELDEQGGAVSYAFRIIQNDGAEPMDVLRFGDTGPGVRPDNYLHVVLDGDPLAFEVETVGEERVVYAAKLTRPMAPGEQRCRMTVSRGDCENGQWGIARRIPWRPGVWVFRSNYIVHDDSDVSVRLEVFRLPRGAKLLYTTPEPDEVHTNEAITVVWRRVFTDWEIFTPAVVYQLEQRATGT